MILCHSYEVRLEINFEKHISMRSDIALIVTTHTNIYYSIVQQKALTNETLSRPYVYFVSHFKGLRFILAFVIFQTNFTKDLVYINAYYYCLGLKSGVGYFWNPGFVVQSNLSAVLF